MLTYIQMGSFLFWLEGSTLFWSKGSNSFGLRGQSELDFPYSNENERIKTDHAACLAACEKKRIQYQRSLKSQLGEH